MQALQIGGFTLGLRGLVIFLITLVAMYMLFVLLRMRRLRKGSPEDPSSLEQNRDQGEFSGQAALNTVPEPATGDQTFTVAPPGLAEELLRHGLEQEMLQLREEVDAMRGELAALRDDMLHELARLRATQTVSPIYGDAMQMAAAGYDPAAIAERCGIARAEAELVVALTKNQDH